MDRSPELARILLEKAGEDELALRLLAEKGGAPDAIGGFHAQQAAEKMIKAVLASRRVRYEWTHDLDRLLKLLRNNDIPAPPEADRLSRLNPYAAELRYAEALTTRFPPGALDWGWALEAVAAVRSWAESRIRGSE